MTIEKKKETTSTEEMSQGAVESPENKPTEVTEEPGTTENLFPDFEEDESLETPPSGEPQKEQPVHSEVPAGTEEVAPATPTEEPAKPQEESAQALNLEEVGDQLVTVNVKGEEKKITLKDVIKGYQTDDFLTKKGQAIGELFKDLQNRAPAATNAPSSEAPATPVNDDDAAYYDNHIKPHVDKQLEDIKNGLQDTLAPVVEAVRPIEYQKTMGKIDTHLKNEGLDDFMEYLPRIETFIKSLPEESAVSYDTAEGFIDVYKSFKLNDLKTGEVPGGALNTQPSAVTPPKTSPQERPKAKVVPIDVEGGGGTPSGADDYVSKYNAAMKDAQETGDFTKVLELKGVI